MPDAPELPIRLPLLYGGISGQPPHIRFPNQVSDAENFTFSVVDGASKRPGSELVAAVVTLPNAHGSGSTAPAAGGTAPATCTPGNHASSYVVTYTLTGTDPDGAAISHVGVTTTVNQHSGKCIWSAIHGSALSNLTPHIAIALDTVDRQWKLTFLLVPATTQPIALYGNTLMAGGSQIDPDTGTYVDTSQFGETGSYLLTITTISVA